MPTDDDASALPCLDSARPQPKSLTRGPLASPLARVRLLVALLTALLLTLPLAAAGPSPGQGATPFQPVEANSQSAASISPENIRRDRRGRIKRSRKQKAAFRRAHPCPSTGRNRGSCPGWEVDHRVPLACGGPDVPDNMQWLTQTENRHKGATGCRR